MEEPAGSTTSEFESEANLVSECIFLVTAPWTHNADPPHLAPSILSFTIHPQSHQLSLCMCSAPHLKHPLKCCCHASEASAAFFSLWRLSWGRRNGTEGSKALHHPPSLFLQVPLVPVNTDWERILAWEQGQRTQQNQSCLCSAEEQHGMQPVSHNIRPFGLASTTFSNWQYNLNDFPRPPNPRAILLLRII